jgi:GDSL-like Lipase/Acylhydrolase family
VPREISVLWHHRPGSVPAVMIVLLAMAGLAGDTALMSTLRGSAARDEVHAAPTLGYYEALINSPQREIASNDPQPPPGWLPFGGQVTGIVTELATYLRWEMKPNLDFRWNGATFQTNRLGFRTPEASLEKPVGTYRILVFGSSNTMGYGVNNSDIYTRHLEQFLNTWIGPSRRVEVVNLAVAGDSPSRRLERMKKEAERWNADWLLCDASVLDFWLEDNHIHSVLQRGLPIPYSFVAEAVSRSRTSGADSIEVFREKFRDQSEHVIAHVYAAWSKEAARLQVPLSIVILPRGDSKAKSPRVFEMIRSLCVQNKLDYFDISGAFDRMEVEEFRISDWDKHPNARGHQVMFECLRNEILRRGQLPGLSTSPAGNEDKQSLASTSP